MGAQILNVHDLNTNLNYLSSNVLSLYCIFDVQNLVLCLNRELIKIIDYKFMLKLQCKTTFNSAFVGKKDFGIMFLKNVVLHEIYSKKSQWPNTFGTSLYFSEHRVACAKPCVSCLHGKYADVPLIFLENTICVMSHKHKFLTINLL